MNSKSAAVFVLTLMFAGLFVPFMGEESDAVGKSDYIMSLSEGDSETWTIDATIGNGHQHTWNLYVVNQSEKHLKIFYEPETYNREVSVIQLPSPMMLEPGKATTGEITISVGEYAKDTAEFTAVVFVTVSNVDPADTETSETRIVFNIKVDSSFNTSGMYNKFLGYFENDLPSPFNKPIFTMIVSIILWVIIFALLSRICIPLLARLLDRTTPEINDRRRLERTLVRLIIPLIFIVAFNQGLIIVGADNEAIALFGSISNVLYVLLVAFIIWKIYVYVVTRILKRFERLDEDSTIDMSLLPLFKMLGRILLAVGCVAAILATFGVDLQGILVSAGVVSLGITMGAQNVLSQFFSGLVILSTRPFKAGDFLKINDKVYIVRKVRLMYTEFTSWESDQIITMPNNVVSSSTIHNMTKDDLPVKQYVYFTVAYGTDLEKAKEIMIETARKNPYVVLDGKHEEPGFRMTNLLNSGIELRLSYFARTFDDTGGSAGQIRMEIYKAFADNGIEIPYDRVQVDILSDKAGEKKATDLTDD